MGCAHEQFRADVRVGRHLDDKTETFVVGYSAEVRIICVQCQMPFEFLGLEPGVDTQGARVSIDGQEARLAIAPKGFRPNPLQRLQGNIKFDG